MPPSQQSARAFIGSFTVIENIWLFDRIIFSILRLAKIVWLSETNGYISEYRIFLLQKYVSSSYLAPTEQ